MVVRNATPDVIDEVKRILQNVYGRGWEGTIILVTTNVVERLPRRPFPLPPLFHFGGQAGVPYLLLPFMQASANMSSTPASPQPNITLRGHRPNQQPRQQRINHGDDRSRMRLQSRLSHRNQNSNRHGGPRR